MRWAWMVAAMMGVAAVGCAHSNVSKDERSNAPASTSSAGATPSTSARAAAPVTVKVAVQVSSFAPGSKVRIVVRNQRSLDAAKHGAECMVGISAPGTPPPPCPQGYSCTTNPSNPQESMVCPAGVQARFGPIPQEAFELPLAPEITVVAQSLVEGEPYEISVSGRAADGCNSVSASPVTGTLHGNTLDVNPPDWMSTLMACSATPKTP